MYTVKGLEKVYSNGEIKNHVLKGVDLQIAEGEFLTILGPSGSGKSTLLHVLSGLDSEYTGEINFKGKSLHSYAAKELVQFRRDNISLIFQQYNLLPTLTAYENVKVGAYLSKEKHSIEEVLTQVGLQDHMNKYPSQLSGGQKQRVAIARALIKQPKVLFCDEPTGALDSSTAKTIMELLLQLNREQKVTVILITHNASFAALSSKVVHMIDGSIKAVDLNDHPLRVDELEW